MNLTTTLVQLRRSIDPKSTIRMYNEDEAIVKFRELELLDFTWKRWTWFMATGVDRDCGIGRLYDGINLR